MGYGGKELSFWEFMIKELDWEWGIKKVFLEKLYFRWDGKWESKWDRCNNGILG